MESINDYKLWLEPKEELDRERERWGSRLDNLTVWGELCFLRNQIRKRKAMGLEPTPNWTAELLRTKLEVISIREISECMELLDMELVRKRLKGNLRRV